MMRLRITVYRMFCWQCMRRWGATRAARHRACPFCGSEQTTWVK